MRTNNIQFYFSFNKNKVTRRIKIENRNIGTTHIFLPHINLQNDETIDFCAICGM